ERPVVDARHLYALGARAGDGAGDELTHEQPGDRGVAIGKVKKRRTGARPGRTSKLHARESRQPYAPRIERRDRIDPEAVERVWARLEERQHVGMAAGHPHEKIGVAAARKLGKRASRGEAARPPRKKNRRAGPGGAGPSFRRRRARVDSRPAS